MILEDFCHAFLEEFLQSIQTLFQLPNLLISPQGFTFLSSSFLLSVEEFVFKSLYLLVTSKFLQWYYKLPPTTEQTPV